MVLDPEQRRRQLGFESRIAGIATEAREPLKAVGIGRQSLRLLIGDHLQPMLESTQRNIGRGEVVDRLLRNPSFGLQGGQHVERAPAAQVWQAASKNQLLRLNEKFDLADTAATELQIVAGYGHLPMAAHGMNLPLHRVNVGKDRKSGV